MKILSPSDINSQRNETSEEANRRTRALAVEEARLTGIINMARARAQKEIAEINQSVEDFKESKESEKYSLIDEIDKLEKKKEVAMVPVSKLRQEAQEVLNEANSRMTAVEAKESALNDEKEALQEEREDIQDLKHDLQEREEEIAISENIVKAERTRQENSAKTLASNWIAYNQAVADFNIKVKEFKNKEAKFISDSEITEKGFENRRNEQDNREKVLNDHDRLIRDKYATLERTIERFK